MFALVNIQFVAKEQLAHTKSYLHIVLSSYFACYMVPVLLHPQHVYMSVAATCSFDHAESFLFGMEVNQGLKVLLVSCQVIFISSIDDWLFVHCICSFVFRSSLILVPKYKEAIHWKIHVSNRVRK